MLNRYIDFYLNAVATPSNVAYLYFMSAKIKMYKDAHSSDSKYLYMMSELAQYLIQNFCSLHGWTLTSFTGNPKLPKDLFTKTQPVKDVYLAKEFLNLHSKPVASCSKSLMPVMPVKVFLIFKNNVI